MLSEKRTLKRHNGKEECPRAWLIHRLENQLRNHEELADLPRGLRTWQSHRKIFKPEVGLMNLNSQLKAHSSSLGTGSAEPANQWSRVESQPPKLRDIFCFIIPFQISKKGHIIINK